LAQEATLCLAITTSSQHIDEKYRRSSKKDLQKDLTILTVQEFLARITNAEHSRDLNASLMQGFCEEDVRRISTRFFDKDL
jgi:hypothetical protein